ncbi:hypothetical protein [Symmachiella dynata]|uniref:Uncharacterized protein n=1 Tax=Symmachiella dynata TaxID=2527995 RepID=A0A517ZUA1_9PLAN|nr:hypothetical protein [Symmachiella dynata]QDT50321.1 hypothetical protein Pan258_43780 [Symmachiella dynata]QDU46044.1 hypothetical protein Mal52_45410 [Symmachiella dynata]
MAKKIVIVSLAASGLVGAIALVDLITGFPFGKFSATMDICMIIGAAVVLYMAYDTIDEVK